MFIGHFAIAFVLIFLFPQVPVWVPLIGVSFPDLLAGILKLLRKEEIIVNRESALMTSIVFKRYPYSHSLVLTNVFSAAVGVALALSLQKPVVVPVFVVASVSHWFLDAVVHLPDLPVLGFDGDRKVGLGLWRWGKTAFFGELLFFAVFAVLFVGRGSAPWVLIIGGIAQAINAPSFLGRNMKSPYGSTNAFAVAILAGFGIMCGLLALVL